MKLVQILDCNQTIGTCCNDAGIVMILDSFRKMLQIIQIIAPIVLIIMASIQLTMMVMNPEEEKLKKSLYNKFIAAVIIFLIPSAVDMVLSWMPSSFTVNACWQEAKVSAEKARSGQVKYQSPYKEDKKQILVDPSKYEKGKKNDDVGGFGSSGDSSSKGSAKGKQIVSYAKEFVGQRYVYGGSWNGEKPYTPTDCSGFVRGVFKHFGINLGRSTSAIWADKSKYTLVSPSNIQAGDVVMYNGHVGILTGNGNQIVHAKGRKYGVVLDSNYKTCSGKAVKGILRIKGVN